MSTEPYREFIPTPEQLAGVSTSFEFGVLTDLPDEYVEVEGQRARIFDGVLSFDDEESARVFAAGCGGVLVRQARIWWSGGWELASVSTGDGR